MSRTIDIKGQRFGRLTVIERVLVADTKRAMWRCLCDCGREKTVDGIRLRNGAVRSCNCFRNEESSRRAKEANYPARYYAQHPEVKKSAAHKQAVQKTRRKAYYDSNKEMAKVAAYQWKKSTNYVKRTVDELADTYVRSVIKNSYGIPASGIPASLVELKREQLRLQRLAKNLQQAATEAKEQQ